MITYKSQSKSNEDLKPRIDKVLPQKDTTQIQQARTSLDKDLFFKAMVIIVEYNKNKLDAIINDRVAVYTDICDDHDEYIAWQDYGRKCVQLIVFKEGIGKKTRKITYPFCVAFLHTPNESYEFHGTVYPEVYYNGRYIYLQSAFPSLLLETYNFDNPYKEIEYHDERGRLCIKRTGLLHYAFDGIRTPELQRSKWF
jgi:hypothetical protein